MFTTDAHREHNGALGSCCAGTVRGWVSYKIWAASAWAEWAKALLTFNFFYFFLGTISRGVYLIFCFYFILFFLLAWPRTIP
jgi:hypothetical protein